MQRRFPRRGRAALFELQPAAFGRPTSRAVPAPVQVYIQRLQAALLSINYKRKFIQERFQRAREELHNEIRVNKRLRTVLEAHLRLPGGQVSALPLAGAAAAAAAGCHGHGMLLRADTVASACRC